MKIATRPSAHEIRRTVMRVPHVRFNGLTSRLRTKQNVSCRIRRDKQTGCRRPGLWPALGLNTVIDTLFCR